MIIDPSGPIFNCGAATFSMMGAGLAAGADVSDFFRVADDFTESLLTDSATLDLH